CRSLFVLFIYLLLCCVSGYAIALVILFLLSWHFFRCCSDRQSFAGNLNFLAHTGDKWMRKYVVIRRPYLCIYDHEDDPVERRIVNLTNAKVSFSEDQAQLLQRPFVFSLYTRHGG